MVEIDQQRLEKRKRSLYAYYNQVGGNLSRFLDYCAEALEYSYAAHQETKELLYTIIKEQGRK